MGDPFQQGVDTSSFKELGKTYRILDVYFKPYASCRWSHPALDAIKALKEEKGFKASEIKHIIVDSFSQALTLRAREATDEETIQYSIPLAVALLLIYDREDLAQFDIERYQDQKVTKLAQRVKLRFNEDLNKKFPRTRAARVTVETDGGKKYTEEVTDPKGGSKNPMTEEELKQKFLSLSGEVIGENKACSLTETVLQLGEKNGIKEIYQLL